MTTATRTATDVADELCRLHRLRHCLPGMTRTEEETSDCIDAQIRVLTERMDREEVYRVFDDDSGSPVLDHALEAYRWLYEGDESPAAMWKELWEVLESVAA